MAEKTTKKKEKLFGDFNTWMELNEAAEGQLQEGDIEALKKLAEENGIDEYDVEDYVDGINPTLATPLTAAIGKLKVERESIKKDNYPVNLINTMTVGMLTTNTNEFIIAVMKQNKTSHKIFEKMRSEASKHKTGNCGVSCGTDKQLEDLIEAYYLKDDAAVNKVLASLYEV